MKDLAVVLHTCDAYERLWSGWWYCWKKFQKDTLLNHFETPLYFLNEEKAPILEPAWSYEECDAQFRWRPTGTGEWSDRLIKGLTDIPEPYVLYMQEDFWLRDTLTDPMLETMMYYAESGQAVKIMGSSRKLLDTLHRHKQPELLRQFKIDSPYFFSHSPTIWYKPHLMACLGPGESPWRNETSGNERCKRMIPLPVHYHYPFSWVNGVHKNVWRTFTEKPKVLPDRKEPGLINAYGRQIIKEMQNWK